jgi:transcriptional regulator with XRE-family HTH domain
MTPAKQAGMKIKARREKLKMTQAELARLAEISRGYLIRLEAGQQDPTLGTLEKLARALGVKVRALVE